MVDIRLELKNWFLDHGISQVDVAKEFGVKNQYINAILNGQKNLSRNFARQIADKYNLSLSYILTGEGSLEKKDEPPLPPPSQPAPLSNVDAIIDIYARLISDLESIRAQAIQTLTEARSMKSDIEDLRHDYMDAVSRLERAISNIESRDTPSIGLAAEDTKCGCS